MSGFLPPLVSAVLIRPRLPAGLLGAVVPLANSVLLAIVGPLALDDDPRRQAVFQLLGAVVGVVLVGVVQHQRRTD